MNSANTGVLNIAGRSSNELYTVSVPSNLLNFCSYDFTPFMENCAKLCRKCIKTGDYPVDAANVLKNSIIGCHKYFENNIRGVFDKIVIDCWIEYICREGGFGVSTLWNSYISCENPFQREIFQRLSEFRGHHAINQWVNLLKIQDYAKRKMEYIFGCHLENAEEASARMNVFDLMFSVAANEQGYSLDAVGSVKIFGTGRIPNAPFVYGGASKEIMRNLFSEVSFAESLPYAGKHDSALSDGEAMDSFSVIKHHLPDYNDNIANTIIKSMSKLPKTIYMPTSFKAMIDLEMDAIVNSGAVLQKCKRCKEFYLKDKYYTSDYCDRVNKEGLTCREIMEKTRTPLTSEEMELFKRESDQLYREMSANVGTKLTQREFSEWMTYFNGIRNNVINGEAQFKDFRDFVDYSKTYSFPKAAASPEPLRADPVRYEEKEAQTSEDERGRVVKPYRFTKVDRRELEQQGFLSPNPQPESGVSEPAPVPVPEPPSAPVSRIIRGTAANIYREIPSRPIPTGNASEKTRSADEALTDFSEIKARKNAEFNMRNSDFNSRAAANAGENTRSEILNEINSDNIGAEKESKSGRLPDLSEYPTRSDDPIEDVLDLFRKREERAEVPAKNKRIDFRAAENAEEKKPPRLKLPDENEEPATSSPAKDREPPSSVKLDELEKQADERKKPMELNRAARVVSAYKTVSDMSEENDDMTDGQDDEFIDFSKILGNIERNDGFADERADEDDVPVSHKTKHVMDAIMKNTNVSPSLVYGRRKAAENNVIIDSPPDTENDE